jgi:hypothetical protein
VQRKLGKFGEVKNTEERLCCVVLSFVGRCRRLSVVFVVVYLPILLDACIQS